MTLSCGLARHLCDKNIWAHVFWVIINSEGHVGQIVTQFLENLHDADKEYGFFQQDGPIAHERH
jgi:hypothetical protein